jgi:hypothetical protein
MTYQLIFSGETLEGQHPAVVRKRLALALKLDDARIQTLFSGNAVIVRKSVDAETATKFQAVFKKAGARLRVVSIEAAGTGPSPAASGSDNGSWEVLPAGSDVLDPEQRKHFVARNIDTSHLALARQLAFLSPQDPYDPSSIEAPAFEVMPAGSRIGDSVEVQPPVLDVDFELAEPGVLMAAPKAPVDPKRIPEPGFDIAEPGVRMSEPSPPPPPAPDVSHIRLEQGPSIAKRPPPG